jgi:hypothetical protein
VLLTQSLTVPGMAVATEAILAYLLVASEYSEIELAPETDSLVLASSKPSEPADAASAAESPATSAMAPTPVAANATPPSTTPVQPTTHINPHIPLASETLSGSFPEYAYGLRGSQGRSILETANDDTEGPSWPVWLPDEYVQAKQTMVTIRRQQITRVFFCGII